MVGKITRWGNSLAVRIPKALAEQVDFRENCEIEILLEDGRIVVQQPARDWNLRQLLRGIQPSNVHRAVEWGAAAGKEIW